MSKIAIVTDTHFGVKKGDDKMTGYFTRFFKEVLFPDLDRLGITHLIHLGDLFDPRSEIATHVFDQVNHCLISEIDKRGMRFDMVVGNHDVRYKNTNHINTPTTLFGAKVGTKVSPAIMDTKYGKLVVDDVYEFVDGNAHIALVPWLSHENNDRLIDRIAKTEANVVMGHFEIAGAKMDRFNVSKHGISQSMFNRFDMVLSGHFHHRSEYGNIQYLGTPYEMTWIDCDDPKGYHILDTETMKLTFVQSPLTMFNRVVYDGVSEIDPAKYAGMNIRLIVENHDDPAKVNALMSQFDDVSNSVTLIDNTKVLATVEAMDRSDSATEADTPEDTLQIILDYVTANLGEGNEELVDIAIAHINALYRQSCL